jgi:hypothetical protein
MSIKTPLPDLLTILLAMKPEISPRTIHVKNDIESSYLLVPAEKKECILLLGEQCAGVAVRYAVRRKP